MKHDPYIIDGNKMTGCSSIHAKMEIPSTVTEIADECFAASDDREKLVSITIHDGVTRIGKMAFFGCENLEHVAILGPADIDDEAFCGCTKLHDVYLADGVKSIGSRCFAHCTMLHSVYIPSSVTTIGHFIGLQETNALKQPVFFCQQKEKGENWCDDWNIICRDFNNKIRYDNHTFYHPTQLGISRSGFSYEAIESVIPQERHLSVAPASELSDEKIALRIADARKAADECRWADLFDLLYIPGFPTLREQREVINRLCYRVYAINSLRSDQVETIQSDATCDNLPDNTTAQYLYGYWLKWNASRLDDLKMVETMLEQAANGGYPDAYMILSDMWESGVNSEGRIDQEKVDYLIDKARKANSLHYFIKYPASAALDEIDTTKPEQNARTLDLIETRIAEDGGEDIANPVLLALKSEYFMNIQDRQNAELYANKAIDRGDLNYGYSMLYIAKCIDENEYLPGGEQLGDNIFAEGAKRNSPYCLFYHALNVDEHSKHVWPETWQEVAHEARLLYEKAALLGYSDACWGLVIHSNSGTLTFPKTYPEVKTIMFAYPFLMHGIMCHSLDCAYWMYKFADAASDNNPDYSEREVIMTDQMDKTPTEKWKQLAMSLYQSNEKPWPNEDDESTTNEDDDSWDEEEEDDSETTETQKPQQQWNGSQNVGILLKMIKPKKYWEHVINEAFKEVVQQGILSDDDIIKEKKLDIFIGHSGQKPTEHYMTIALEDFPKMLSDQMLTDDIASELDGLASIHVKPSFTAGPEDSDDNEVFIPSSATYTLPSEDKSQWPQRWDECILSIYWRADRYTDGDSIVFAKPGTDLAKNYPNVTVGKPLSLSRLKMSSSWCDLFLSPIVTAFDDNSLSLKYGNNEYTLHPNQIITLETNGKDYTTFELSVGIKDSTE